MPRKRPKYGTEDTNLPDPAPPSSPSGSTKASEDEANGRRKVNSRTRVTSRELNNYADVEMGWLGASLSRCRKVSQKVKAYNELTAKLAAVNSETEQKIDRVSANAPLQRKMRLEVGEEMKRLERKRRELAEAQRQAIRDIGMEAVSMEQNLQRWYGQESKFTKRIEKSR